MNHEQSIPKMGLEEYIIMVPFLVSVLLTLASFVMKPFSPVSSGILTKLSYYAYAWLCCISVSQCVRRNKHLQISLFEDRFPASLNKVLGIFSELIGFVVVLCVFIGSFMLLTNALSTGATEAGTPIPLALGYFAPILGYGMALVRYVMKVVKGGAQA